jgi:aminoglycoside phosphotransferase (APT) family kinase protein
MSRRARRSANAQLDAGGGDAVRISFRPLRHPNHREPSTLPAELRRSGVPTAVRAWVEAVTAVRISRARRLPGASSTAVDGLYLGDGTRLVLRRYTWPGFLDVEPMAPQREIDGLSFALAHGLRVPEVIATDITGEQVGDNVPVLLMSFIRGRALPDPDPFRLAEVAAAIHDIDADGFAHDYFPWYEGTMTAPPPIATRPVLWERAIELWHSAMPAYSPTFIHRDFHPGNVHWLRGRLSGVLDWANTCRGPRGCDLATCRSNLLDLAGPDAADRFIAAYRSITGEEYHPYWEMASILESDPADWTKDSVADAEPRLAWAVEELHA